jgi:multidrug efflux system membrane fusion protein
MGSTGRAGLGLVLAVSACGHKADPDAGRPGGRPTPVSVAAVERRDVPIYLEGLGSIAGAVSVAVRTQVDGRLDRIFFEEGRAVHKGDVLAQIDPRPFQAQLEQAQGALARDKAQLEASRRDLARYEELASKSLIPRQQADDQRATAGQFAGAVQIDEAAIATARLNLDYARIVSPIDGLVGIRNVDPGNLVHVSDQNPIVTVTQLDPVAVTFSLPQDALSDVAQHQAQAPLDVVVFSRDGTTELGRGKLAVIDNAISATTATMRLKAFVPNPKRALWPNQFVKVRLLVSVQRGVVVVPAPALQRGPQGTFVYVTTKDDTVQARPVTVASLQGELAVVSRGLEPGDSVVTEGQAQLRPGAKVAAHPASGGSGRGGGQGGSQAAGPSGQRAGYGGEQPGEGGGRNRGDADGGSSGRSGVAP